MKSIVVYESHWGNTAAIARSIAEGIGGDARALTTDEATVELLAAAELVVAGAPVLGFRLATDEMLASVANERGGPPPDLSHPSMRAWLSRLSAGRGAYAAFETGLRWSPGSATGAIGKEFERAGYRQLTKGRRFVVKGRHGPLRDGEVERARQWGAELAASAKS